MTGLTTTWQTLVDNQPALQFDGDQSYRSAPDTSTHGETTPQYYLCHQLGILQVSGIDATTFLQGQLTADTEQLENGATNWAAHCNAKGRVIANYFLHKTDAQNFLLILPAAQLDNARQALEKYAVFSKVEIVDLSTTLFAIGCLESNGHTGGASYQIPIDSAIGLLLYHRESIQDGSLPAAIAQAVIGGSADWQQALNLRGYSLVLPETQGEFIPQMLNMDLLDGISFSKGCYTGQEVIARLKYRGEVKRRCFRFSATLDEQAPPATGDSLFDEQQRAIGEIASICSIEGVVNGLAVFKLKDEQPPARAWFQCENSQLSKIPLQIDPGLPPYAINNN